MEMKNTPVPIGVKSNRSTAPPCDLRMILDSIPDIAWVKDLQGRFIAANERFMAWTGRAEEEILGRTDFDLWPHELAEKYRCDDAHVITAHVRKRFDERFEDPEGTIFWMETIKSPIVNESGNVVGVTGIARPTTSHRCQELIHSANVKITDAAQRNGTLTDFCSDVHQALSEMMDEHGFPAGKLDEVLDRISLAYSSLLANSNHSAGEPQGDAASTVAASGESLQVLAEDLATEVPLGKGKVQWQGVPLLEGQHSYGAVIVRSTKMANQNGEADHALLTHVAGQVASSLIRGHQEESLEFSTERLTLVGPGSNVGIWDWNMETGGVFYSDRFAAIMETTADQLHKSIDGWKERVHEDDIERVLEELRAHEVGLTEYFQSEHRVRTQPGKHRWVLMRGAAVRSRDGKAIRVAGSMTEITGRKEPEVANLADPLRDEMTGLPNRRLFLDRVSLIIAQSKRNHEHRYAVLFLDLDGLNIINGIYGRRVGDGILTGFGERLKSCIRDTDIAARIGGDQFSVLLDEIADACEAEIVARRILASMERIFVIEDQSITLSTSIGIAIGDSTSLSSADIVHNAKAALDRAKKCGPGQYAL